MFGTKNTFINLDFRTIDEVLADKYISKEAKYATSVKYQLHKSPEMEDAASIKFVRSALEDFSVRIIEDDERKDTAPLLQSIPQQQKSDD
jgi:uncharacterized membrane protein YgaE (UPF0421/DUF939 family)